jgi:hypothetical protein
MTKLHIGEGPVRGSRAGRRPPTDPRPTCRPWLERLETRCLPGFLAPLAYDTGGAVSVAVGDFNGDGIPDLAVAGYGGVSVLLGQGDGTFLTAQSYATGNGPVSVAVGDFNGDGKPDLAVANDTYPGTVSVLLGQGDGTFQAAQGYATGNGAFSVAVGDFNGDGKQDLAVANRWNDKVSVLLGQGDGTFLPAQSYAAGNGPVSVAVGDFNKDGLLDLAVAGFGFDAYYPYGFNDETVRVLLGQGDGTFQPAQSFPAGKTPGSVAVGDFNGDGKLDLAVANSAYPGTVSVLLGKGDGTFLLAQSYAAGVTPYSVAVGDFNGDGKQDLAVANQGAYPFANGSVSVLLGKGDGTFLPAQSYPAGSIPVSVAVGDFNGDGWPDLAVANFSSKDVSILLNDANWPVGPSRPGGGPSHPPVPERLPPSAMHPFPSGEEQRLAASALLSLPPSPGNRPVIEPPAPLALPGADPPRPTILAVLLGEGRPSALADPRAGPRARGAPSITCSRSWPPTASGTTGPTTPCCCWRERRLGGGQATGRLNRPGSVPLSSRDLRSAHRRQPPRLSRLGPAEGERRGLRRVVAGGSRHGLGPGDG